MNRLLIVLIAALVAVAVFSFRHLATIDNTNDTVGYMMVASLALLGGIFAFLIIRAAMPSAARTQPFRMFRLWMNAKERELQKRATEDGAASSERRNKN